MIVLFIELTFMILILLCQIRNNLYPIDTESFLHVRDLV